MNGYVSNKKLREAFLASDLTASGLAWRLGYTRIMKSPAGTRRAWTVADDSPVKRALGLKEYSSKGYPCAAQRSMQVPTALRYCEALGLDPIDIDL